MESMGEMDEREDFDSPSPYKMGNSIEPEKA
jgi:hypothetical protein